MRRVTEIAAAIWLAAAAAAAAPPTDEVARGLVYTSRATELVLADGAPGPEELRAAAAGLDYYGAVAGGTGRDGARVLFRVAGFNSDGAAAAAALALCSRKLGRAGHCTGLVQVRPRGWEPRALQLGARATEMYLRFYLRDAGPKAFAVSRGGATAALARGPHATRRALAACRAGRSGLPAGFACETRPDRSMTCVAGPPARDCEIAIEN